MRRFPLALALFAAGTAAAAALGAGAAPEMRVAPGEPATGDIVFAGEEDRVAIDLLEGMKLTFTARPSKKSPLRCGADVLDPTETVMSLTTKQRKEKKGAVTLKSVVAPATGTYFAAVRGTADGPLGDWDLATKATAPPKLPKVSGTVPAGDSAEFTFDALEGMTVGVTVAAAKGSPLRPHVDAIVGPDDREIDLGASTVKRKETTKTSAVSKVRIPSFGTWRVRVTGVESSGGPFTATVSRKAAKAPRTKRDLHGASGGEDAAGDPVAIDVLAASGDAADEVAVDVGGTARLVARGTWGDGRTRDLTRIVSWATVNRGAATVASGAGGGLLTGVAAGGTTLQAWTGTVEAREALVLVGGATVASVDVVPDGAAIAAGDALRLQAAATIAGGGADTGTVDVTRVADWQQTGTALSSVAGGRVVGASLATSQVTATAGGATSPAAAVEVTGRRVVALALSPGYAELTPGSPTRAFTVTATYGDGTTLDVTPQCTFASDNLSAATTSGSTATRVADGTAGIRATLGGVTSRPAVVNVGPVALVSVTVTGTASVAQGGTTDLAATGVFQDGGTRDVTEACSWTSGDPATATVSTTLGRRGRVAGVLASGSASTVAASLTVGGTARVGSVDVSCGAPVAASLRIVPEVTSAAVGGTAALRVIATLTDGTVADVTGTATWGTSNGVVAAAAAGVVTGGADGGAVVTATLDGVTARAVVLVGTGRLTGVSLTTGSTDAYVGETATYVPSATFAPSAGGDPLALLGGSERLFLAAPLDGAPSGATVTARAAGTSDVGFAFGGLAATPSSLHGLGPIARGITAFPQSAYVVFGTDTQLAAQVRRSDGFVTDEAAAVTWTSLQTQYVTVGGTGLAHAVAKGTSTVRAALASPSLQATCTVAVLGDPPAIVSVSPGTVLRGQAGTTFTVTGSGLDGPSAQVAVSGAGVTVVSGPTPNVGGTQATFVLDVAANAATGLRDVTYTTVVGSDTKTSAIQIVVPTPTISGISPTNVDVPGAGSTNQLLTVTGTNFVTGDDFVLATHSGVSLGAVTIVNPTTMTATVTVASGTAKTRLDVTLRQSAANGGATQTLTNALKIGPPDPTVASVVPDHFLPGQAATAVTVTGTGFQSGISIAFPGESAGGFTTSGASRTSSTQITFTITVGQTAAYSVQDLRLTNPSDVASTFTGAFAITPRDPTISSVSARTIAKGASDVDVTVKGTGFRSGAGLRASGSGVTFSNVTVADPETITAKLAATSGAATGARDVTVSHASSEGGHGATLAGALTVVNGTPTVTAVNPSSVGRTGSGGATRRVPVEATGTNFSAGATVTVTRSGGSGLTIASGTTTVVSSTKLRFDLDVTGTATTGSWDVRVTNPSSVGDSGTSGAGLLQIVSETTLCVNRVTPSSGSSAGGDRVTVEGSGFARGCRVEFGAEKAAGVQFIDQNTLVCTVPPPADPSSAGATTLSTTGATEVDVKVTNLPGGANATLTKGFAYEAEAGPFQIAQSYPADSSTGNPQNLKSAVVRLTQPANTHTAVFGFTSGTNCFWFEAYNYFVSGQTGGFGADPRFLVFSRSGGGNLPISSTQAGNGQPNPTPGRYILNTPTAVLARSGRALVPSKLASGGTDDQWSFDVSSSVTDSTAPTASAGSPTSGATGVGTRIAVTAGFSEVVDPLTVTSSSVQLKQGSTPLSCRITLSDDLRTVTLVPTEELATNTQYTVALSSTVADLCGNTLSNTSWTFTTQSSDQTNPVIDAVVLADLPPSVDGSGTYLPGRDTVPGSGAHESAGSATAFDSYLPRYGWSVALRWSDTGDGVDPATLHVVSNVAVGSTQAGNELAGRFTATATGATWTVGSSDAFTTGDDATLTFTVQDKAGRTSSAAVITFDVVDIDATAQGSGGGDLDPFDARETWILRFDRDVYTCSFSTNGSTQQVTTSTGADGVPDVEQALRLCGLQSTNMTTAAASTVNGTSVGTNAIVLRLFEERVRATLRARYGVAEDGSRDAGSANVEFLLPGEQGSLASRPTLATSSNYSTGNAWSEIELGGDTQTNSNQTSYYGTIGYAFLDTRNRYREANLNSGSSSYSNNNGIFVLNMFKAVANVSTTGTDWGVTVLAKLVTAKGGTPVGESSDDDDVLAGSFDRTSGGNTTAQNTRYDAIMDAIEMAALSVSGVTAHEIGHSVGLVADYAPKTGLFGNAHHSNAFTEAVTGSENTSSHLDFLGNDIMGPASSVDDRTATGTEFQHFDPLDTNYLLHRQVHDEGR